MKFSDIIGQDGAKNKLRHLIDNDRIPHAILLSGAIGIGKLALARAAAQYIHCTNHVNGDSCGVCNSCIQHQSLNHGDLFFSFPFLKKDNNKKWTSDDFIEKWRNFITEYKYESFERWLPILDNDNSQPKIYVDESDRIIHKMSMASYSSKYKVLIMWLPEKMNDDCANKLLKIIEEPFPDSIFILVSDKPQEVLPTILSRTQNIEVLKPPTPLVAQYLHDTFNVDLQDAMAIAAPADGNIVMAEESLSLDSENKQFFEMFVQIMRMAYSRDMKGLKKWSEAVSAYKRERERRFMIYCCRMLRENFIYNIHIKELNYLTREEEQFSRKFAPFINERNISQMIEEFSKAESDIQGNANAKIVLFDLAIKITKLIKI
ncbi:MAG: DNA polymerase III subunit delta [Muribaculaceae bacterium]